jgi:hypothetical protein
MVAKTSEITLDGVSYTIHAFNIGELERVTDIVSETSGSGRSSFSILRIAMERAEPKPENFDAIEASPEEIVAAMQKVLNLAGLGMPTGNPQTAGPPAA